MDKILDSLTIITNYLISKAELLGTAIKSEAPEILRQLIAYQIFSHALKLISLIIVGIGMGWLIKKGLKFFKREKAEYGDIGNFSPGVLTLIFPLGILIGMFFLCVDNIEIIGQLYIAPKVFILEYLKDLIPVAK